MFPEIVFDLASLTKPIATALALGDIDGRPLTDRDVVSTMVLLAAAGNDTTKHTASWTALNLCRNPEQREWLLADFEGRIGQSIEEFVRFATVVITFPRTVTTDVELHGQQLREGEVVNLFYCSGNRDEALFADPNRFDLARPRATNVAFGGRGVHYCLGNVVAKVQLRSLFWHVLTKLPGLELDGEPTYLHSDFINGISRMPVRA